MKKSACRFVSSSRSSSFTCLVRATLLILMEPLRDCLHTFAFAHFGVFGKSVSQVPSRSCSFRTNVSLFLPGQRRAIDNCGRMSFFPCWPMEQIDLADTDMTHRWPSARPRCSSKYLTNSAACCRASPAIFLAEADASAAAVLVLMDEASKLTGKLQLKRFSLSADVWEGLLRSLGVAAAAWNTMGKIEATWSAFVAQSRCTMLLLWFAAVFIAFPSDEEQT